jgi:transcriptional regulator with GAF, ATPase, and Fis domain
MENSVERALIRALTGPPNEGIFFDDVSRPPQQFQPIGPNPEQEVSSLDEVMRNHIKDVLFLCNNKINGPNEAAGRLGVNPSTLRHRMRKLGIAFEKKRKTNEI